MRALPGEEVYIPNPKNKKKKHRKQTDPKLAAHAAGIKQITIRLAKYAEHDLSDAEILALLNDTRNQVLGLHITRKQLQQLKRKKRK